MEKWQASGLATFLLFYFNVLLIYLMIDFMDMKIYP